MIFLLSLSLQQHTQKNKKIMLKYFFIVYNKILLNYILLKINILYICCLCALKFALLPRSLGSLVVDDRIYTLNRERKSYQHKFLLFCIEFKIIIYFEKALFFLFLYIYFTPIYFLLYVCFIYIKKKVH